MLEKKDKSYAINTSVSALLPLMVSVILSYFLKNPISIAISVLTGEIVFAISMIRLMKNEDNLLSERIKFSLKNFFIFPIGLIIFYLLGDNLPGLVTFWGVFAIIMIIIHTNKFKLPRVIN